MVRQPRDWISGPVFPALFRAAGPMLYAQQSEHADVNVWLPAAPIAPVLKESCYDCHNVLIRMTRTQPGTDIEGKPR